MALLRNESELVEGFGKKFIFDLFNKVYTNSTGKGLDINKFTYNGKGVIYDEDMFVIPEIKGSIETLKIHNIPLLCVKGSFSCAYCFSLKTLEGGPQEINGHFYCNNCNNLTSLQGVPTIIPKDFDCSNCYSLKTLEGGPREVGRNYLCIECKSLTSLQGSPKKVGNNFHCDGCHNLCSFEEAPKEVGGCFVCDSYNISLLGSSMPQDCKYGRAFGSIKNY